MCVSRCIHKIFKLTLHILAHKYISSTNKVIDSSKIKGSIIDKDRIRLESLMSTIHISIMKTLSNINEQSSPV